MAVLNLACVDTSLPMTPKQVSKNGVFIQCLAILWMVLRIQPWKWLQKPGAAVPGGKWAGAARYGIPWPTILIWICSILAWVMVHPGTNIFAALRVVITYSCRLLWLWNLIPVPMCGIIKPHPARLGIIPLLST